MDQQASNPQQNSVTLEPLDQSGITLHWPHIEETLRQSLGDNVEVAAAQHALRNERLGAWAIWIPDGAGSNRVAGILVTDIVHRGLSGGTALSIYAIHGMGISKEQWIQCIGFLKAVCRERGIGHIIAITPHDNVVQLAQTLGFRVTSLLGMEV